MPNWIIASLYYAFITCWSLGFILRFRFGLTSTIAMITPMVSGMIIGFGSGTIMGTIFAPNLLLSLFISLFIGIFSGGIIGFFISIGAFLNGALSGMMAGMMGAMLIGMLPSSQWDRVIFGFMVTGGILQFVHTLMLQGQIEETTLKQSTWIFRTPVLMLFVIATLIFLFSANGHAAVSSSEKKSEFKQETVPSPADELQGHTMMDMK